MLVVAQLRTIGLVTVTELVRLAQPGLSPVPLVLLVRPVVLVRGIGLVGLDVALVSVVQ